MNFFEGRLVRNGGLMFDEGAVQIPLPDSLGATANPTDAGTDADADADTDTEASRQAGMHFRTRTQALPRSFLSIAVKRWCR